MRTKAFSFRLFGFPVDVDIFFFLIALLLVGDRRDLLAILIWVGAVFISVLLHELGHAFVGYLFGRNPRIRLYAFGGLTSWDTTYWNSSTPRSRLFHSLAGSEDIAISSAGPLAGFGAGIFVMLFNRALSLNNAPFYFRILIWDLVFVNICWSILNLLPILPLDGGHIMQEIVFRVRGDRDRRLPYKISIGVGIAVGILTLAFGMTWGIFFCGIFIYNNYMQLKIWERHI